MLRRSDAPTSATDWVLHAAVRGLYDPATYTCYCLLLADENRTMTDTHLGVAAHLPIRTVRACLASLSELRVVSSVSTDSRHQPLLQVNRTEGVLELKRRWRELQEAQARAWRERRNAPLHVELSAELWVCQACDARFGIADIVSSAEACCPRCHSVDVTEADGAGAAEADEDALVAQQAELDRFERHIDRAVAEVHASDSL